MSLLIKNGYVLTLDDEDHIYERGDVHIRGRMIDAVGPDIDVDPASVDQVINATGKLVMPGLINAHIHGDENFRFGLATGQPNEIWNLSVYPPFGGANFEARVYYLLTMMGAIAMVKGGTTSVQDHSRGWDGAAEDAQEEYFGGYLDVGMRVSMAVNIQDRPWHEMIPGLSDMLSPELLKETTGALSHWRMRPVEEVIEECEAVIQRWHGHDGLVTVAVGPSAPQRCTDELLKQSGDLARKYDLPLHMHLLETRIQKAQSRQQYGGAMARYLQEMGLLESRLGIIHAIWPNDEDLQLIGEAGCCIIHVPGSNLFMGSGVMPFARYVDSGNPLALGTDGVEAGTISMFETMKLTALLHTVTTPDYERWPSARQVLGMATRGGARSMGLEAELGALASGMIADVILLDMKTVSFTPLNDVVNQVVFSENGSSVDTVIINGQVVMAERRLLTIDEQAIMDEIRSYMPEISAAYQATKASGQKLRPTMDEIYRRASQDEPDHT